MCLFSKSAVLLKTIQKTVKRTTQTPSKKRNSKRFTPDHFTRAQSRSSRFTSSESLICFVNVATASLSRFKRVLARVLTANRQHTPAGATGGRCQRSPRFDAEPRFRRQSYGAGTSIRSQFPDSRKLLLALLMQPFTHLGRQTVESRINLWNGLLHVV